MTDRLLHEIDQTARAFSVSRSQVYKLAKRGDLELVHIGRRALVTDESMRAFVERLRVTAGGGEAA